MNKESIQDKPVRRKRKNQCGRFGERIFSGACIVPSLIGVLIFFLIPFGIVIYYSFINNPVTAEFVGLDNYTALLKNVAFKKAVSNTAAFTLISVPLAVILSLWLASLLERKIPGKSIIRTFLLSPLMVPTASVVLVWQVLFHNHGTLNSIIETFGGQGIDWLKSSHGQVIIIAMFLWKNLGYNMILFMSALASVPKDILEVAELEGAGKFYQFIHIKLRYLSPTILFVFILSLINSFKIFREVYLLTGDHPYSKLYMLQHFMNNTFNSIDYQKLSAAAILFALVMIVVMAVLMAADNKFGKDVE
ncbi:MAG: sugar ABC transporter permease [Ruminococcus sp.]|nr:sugar ABC transporter permease [Ruminococcus sp.]